MTKRLLAQLFASAAVPALGPAFFAGIVLGALWLLWRASRDA